MYVFGIVVAASDETPIGLAPEELIDRNTVDLADRIVQGHVDRSLRIGVATHDAPSPASGECRTHLRPGGSDQLEPGRLQHRKIGAFHVSQGLQCP
jgi:hypothetical protein